MTHQRPPLMPDDHDAWLALLSLPRFGGRRMWDVWSGPGAVGAWDDLRRGRAPWTSPTDVAVRHSWRDAARILDPSEIGTRHRAAAIRLTVHGDGVHPCGTERDPHLPPVLLWRGSGSLATAGGPGREGPPRVGIIGTRRATRYGIDLARDLGSALAAAGVCVVSGLASGIDAAAHHGVLGERQAGAPAAAAPAVHGTAPVLAVVGTGLDVVYPRRNRQLWSDVATCGLVVSEHPLGTPPAAWRFPARNRVLAALCDVVVVVESHERGGSLITAGVAGSRGVPVLAVPGAVHNPGSKGTNRLISDGCQPCLGIDDVFDALALVGRPASGAPSGPVRELGARAATPPRVDGVAATVLDGLGWTRRSFEDVVARCDGVSLGDVAVALAELEAGGLVTGDGGWYEQVRR